MMTRGANELTSKTLVKHEIIDDRGKHNEN